MTSTTSNFRILRATQEHVSLIHSFSKEMAEWEKAEFNLTEDELSAMMFGERAGLEGLIATLDDTAIGFAVFFHNFPTFSGKKGLFIEDIWVTPSRRGKGFGKALLAELARLAVERQCCRLEWWTMDWNTSAREFYKSLGAITKEQCIIHIMKDDALQRLAAHQF